MAAIKSKDTRPEIAVRSMLGAMRVGYDVHRTDLPGKPDIVLSRRKKVIFVHGCFWHGHGCHLFRWPSTRSAFWRAKIKRNRLVDRRSVRRLKQEGWRVLTIWECALKGRKKLSLEAVVSASAKWLRKGSSELVIRGVRGSR